MKEWMCPLALSLVRGLCCCFIGSSVTENCNLVERNPKMKSVAGERREGLKPRPEKSKNGMAVGGIHAGSSRRAVTRGFVSWAWGADCLLPALSCHLVGPETISGTPRVCFLGNTCGKESGLLQAWKCLVAGRRVTLWAAELPLGEKWRKLTALFWDIC